jgi:uncharacterized protein YpmS
MRKWTKSLMLLAGLLLIFVLAIAGDAFRRFKGVPAWYRHPTVSAAQRELLAQRAFNKFTEIQNAAALARQDEISEQADGSSFSPNSIVVSFSDDELNAFVEKWASFANSKSDYDRYVDDPIINIAQGQVLLSAQVKDLGAIVSLELSPQIDANGRLDLHLDRVVAGRLRLPEIFVRPYEQHLTHGLEQNLPRWRQEAAIDSDGAANSDLISAAIARLFIHTLNHSSADAVLFLPLVEHHANVPVRVRAVMVTDHNLTMSVLPLNAKERAELVQRVRGNDE